MNEFLCENCLYNDGYIKDKDKILFVKCVTSKFKISRKKVKKKKCKKFENGMYEYEY